MRRPYNVRFISIPRSVSPPSRRPFSMVRLCAPLTTPQAQEVGTEKLDAEAAGGPERSAKSGWASPGPGAGLNAECPALGARRAVNGRQGASPLCLPLLPPPLRRAGFFVVRDPGVETLRF